VTTWRIRNVRTVDSPRHDLSVQCLITLVAYTSFSTQIQTQALAQFIGIAPAAGWICSLIDLNDCFLHFVQL